MDQNKEFEIKIIGDDGEFKQISYFHSIATKTRYGQDALIISAIIQAKFFPEHKKNSCVNYDRNNKKFFLLFSCISR